jgi:hypothetical protein
MDTLYLICAILGATVLVGQFLLGLFGVGHETDADHDCAFHHDSANSDHGASWFAGMLSIRAITSAIMLFGLCGLAATSAGEDVMSSLGVACLGGVGAMVLVAQLMKFLHGLAEEGNVKIERSVGKPATVYLTVPPGRAHAGKVQMRLQNRTVEYQAVTAHPDPLPTGSKVTVVSVINSDTVEVTPEPLSSKGHHHE